MEFSKKILEDKNIRNRIFKSGVQKSKNLLMTIFDSMDTRTELESEDKFSYIHAFYFNDRYITANYLLEQENNEDLLKEVLIIEEKHEKEIKIPDSSNKSEKTNIFWHNIIQLQSWIEKTYDVNFLTLDPNDKDPQIIKEDCNEDNHTWIGIISPFYREGEIHIHYVMNFNSEEQTAKITYCDKNYIYL